MTAARARELLLRFGAIWLALAVIGWVSMVVAGGPVSPFSDELARFPFLDMWARWDAQWYERIAREGYFFSATEQSSVAFFPAYPLLMRALTVTGLGPLGAGIVLTTCLGALAFVLFETWAQCFVPPQSARLAGWVLAVWPLAFFLYGAVYSDALFLVLVCGAFLCLEKGWPWAAVLLGAIATATRPVAPAVVLGLLARSLELRWRKHERFRPIDFVPVLAALGLAGWMAWQWQRFGTPTAFIETQAGWNQTPGPRTWFKLSWVQGERFWERLPRSLMHLGLSVLMLAMIPRVWKRVGAAYALFVAAIIGLPFISSIDFIGLGRYAIAGFPAVLAFSTWLEEHPRWARAWFPVSAVLLGICVSKFAIGRYIS
ncbi:MAG: mannosyltransferase family protein [Myxococcaceae bacterium]